MKQKHWVRLKSGKTENSKIQPGGESGGPTGACCAKAQLALFPPKGIPGTGLNKHT